MIISTLPLPFNHYITPSNYNHYPFYITKYILTYNNVFNKKNNLKKQQQEGRFRTMIQNQEQH